MFLPLMVMIFYSVYDYSVNYNMKNRLAPEDYIHRRDLKLIELIPKWIISFTYSHLAAYIFTILVENHFGWNISDKYFIFSIVCHVNWMNLACVTYTS